MGAGDAGFLERYGPWALVAGASEGLGQAWAEALASRGLNLALVARRAELLEQVGAGLRRRHGVEVRPIPLDLSAEDAAARLVQETEALPIGLLVYNAAFAPSGPFLSIPPERHLALLAVNCRAPMLLCHAFGERLAARGRGGLVLMGSMAGLQGSPGVAHYAASKAYDLVLAEGLWAELGPRGVDVLACVAGATRTPGFEANPSPPRLLAPPVMEPAAVVEEALRALGRRPSLVAGFWNRLAGLFMRVFMTRRQAVRVMAGSTMQLGKPERR